MNNSIELMFSIIFRAVCYHNQGPITCTPQRAWKVIKPWSSRFSRHTQGLVRLMQVGKYAVQRNGQFNKKMKYYEEDELWNKLMVWVYAYTCFILALRIKLYPLVTQRLWRISFDWGYSTPDSLKQNWFEYCTITRFILYSRIIRYSIVTGRL